MTALAKPARRLPLALTDAERNVMAAMADLFETADQLTISRSRVALVLDARKVDRLHELLDIATLGDGREPDCDEDFCVTDQRHDAEDDEREADVGDEGEEGADTDGPGPAFQMDQSRDRWCWPP